MSTTRPKDSSRKITSLKLTECPEDGQSQMPWNGDYKKHLAHRLRIQAMGRSQSTALSPTSLTKLVELLLKHTEITGIETNPSPKQCKKLPGINDKDTEQ
jgi:hypothetical protein